MHKYAVTKKYQQREGMDGFDFVSVNQLLAQLLEKLYFY